MKLRLVACVMGSAVVAAASSCDFGSESRRPPSSLSVYPPSARLPPGGSATFVADAGGVTPSVDWTVDEAGGGNIDGSGFYVAPQTLGVFHVRATVAGSSGVTGTAEVTVANVPACATEPLRATGTIYYYCDCSAGAATGCIPGNDGTTGTSAAAPRRTFGDAASRFRGMAAGDTIAFCRGGAWTAAGSSWANPSCTAASPCDVRDYTPSWANASTPRPIFTGSGDLFDMNRVGHEEGYRFRNLDVRGTRWAFFLYRDVTDVEICNVAVDGATIALHDAGGEAGDGRNARITLRDSQIRNCSQDGVLGGSSYLAIDSNVFENNGFGLGIFSHTIYIEGETLGGNANPQTTVGLRIVNNEIRTGSPNACGGTMMVLHGRHTGLTVENNYLGSTNGSASCYGIQLDHGSYPYSVYFRNAVVRRNWIVNSGGGAEGISLTSCTGCMITDNIVHLTAPFSTGINVPEQPTNPGGDVNSGTLIQNNSLYLTDPAADYGIWVHVEGAGYVVENNAVWTAGGNCWSVTQPTLRMGNNSCRTSGGVDVATLWVDAASGDFHPANPGPLIAAANQAFFSPLAIGSFPWSPTDTGILRAQVPPIDIGAFVR